MRAALLLILGSLVTVSGPLQAQQPVPHNQDKPPGPALSPREAIAQMKVPPGFEVELVVSEPDLVNPVAMTFDERGRIWITESLEYPRREPGPGRDRVKVFEDADGDGRAERVTLFTEGLNIPSGIAVGHGGVWVANSPDILFYPDTDRDLKPDGPPEVVATGFGRADTHELPNSLTWGPDGWLYGWNGVFNPSRVQSSNGKIYEFTCAIFRIHPRTREFQVWCEGTSNPWGIAFNQNGDLFSSACVIDHLWHLVESAYYIRQGGPYPAYTWPMGSIVDFRHQKAAYCGITYFDSDAYPPEFRGKLYLGNIHGNCVNTDGLEPAGATYRGTLQPDLLAANDAWFMPVVQKTGPDGCLYVLDWYDRYHCYQDANRDPAGIDRLKGRLYRLRYKQSPRRANFDLAAESDAQLIDRLGVGNGFDREIAQRLLTERLAAGSVQPPTTGALNRLLLDEQADRRARLGALWALIGAEKLRIETFDRLLEEADPTFRAWAVRAAGDHADLASLRADRAAACASDPAPEVALQAVIASAKISDPSVLVSTCGAAMAAHGNDPLVRHIVWQNLHPRLDQHALAFLDLLEQGLAAKQPGWDSMMTHLVERLAEVESPNTEALANLFRLLASDPAAFREDLQTFAAILADALVEGTIAPPGVQALRQALQPQIDSMTPRLETPEDRPLLVDLTLMATAMSRPDEVDQLTRIVLGTWVTGQSPQPDDRRVRALAVLIKLRASEVVLPAIEIAAVDQKNASTELRGRLIAELGRLDDPKLADTLLKLHNDLEPEPRARMIELLCSRPAWAQALLDAVKNERIPQSSLNVNQLRRLQSSPDPAVVARVKETFGSVREGRNEQRELVVAQMRRFLRETPGDPYAGRPVFNRVCAQCHVMYGDGQEVGPELTSNGRNDWDQLISNVFDPSLVIGQGYQAVTVATSDGRVLTGLLAEDSDQRVQLKVQGGKVEVIPRSQVDEMKAAEVSLMPEDLEKQLSPQELADLFAFLALDKPPGDPDATLLPGAPQPQVRASQPTSGPQR